MCEIRLQGVYDFNSKLCCKLITFCTTVCKRQQRKYKVLFTLSSPSLIIQMRKEN